MPGSPHLLSALPRSGRHGTAWHRPTFSKSKHRPTSGYNDHKEKVFPGNPSPGKTFLSGACRQYSFRRLQNVFQVFHYGLIKMRIIYQFAHGLFFIHALTVGS